MKLVTLYESVLVEGKVESCLVKFGKKLFDPQLSNSGVVEPNTDIENEYLTLINQFTSGNHDRTPRPAFVKSMKELKGCMSHYPEVLEPEGTVYRGENISLTNLLTQYEDIADDLKNGGIFDFNYKPRSIIQSWVSDKSIAKDFTKVSPSLLKHINDYKSVIDNPEQLANFVKNITPQLGDITCPIVIKLNTSKDDFLFKSEYFASLSKHEFEKELLRINNQPTRVSGEIISELFDSVYGILKAIKLHRVH